VTITTLVIVIATLAAGTYAIRFAGVALAGRVALSEQVRQLLILAAIALLAALAATTALIEAGRAAGVARPAGVLVGMVLAWRRLPFAVVVLAAAGTAAALRVLGVR
jgi:branched-subunit amino acid transport protein